MHRIKHNARKSAWYQSDEDPTTYNPFARVQTGKKVRDIENLNTNDTLYHTQTENDAVSPVEERRKKSYEQERDLGHPPRASTLPTSITDGTGHLRPGDEIHASSSGSNQSEKVEPYQQSKHAAFDDIPPPSSEPENQPRRRKGGKMRKFFHIKPKDDQDSSEADSEDEKKKPGPDTSHITIGSQLKAIFFSWINILLIMVPVGFAVEYAGTIPGAAIFVINFVAIIPLAALLSFATEELALYAGEVIGGLLNATFGNAVELIVSVIALAKKEILIVQTSLIGSMLSNLLLVLGMCFFFGGLRRVEQHFNITVAQTAASLLALAVGSLVIPTAFRIFANNDDGVTPTSRGTAVLLLVTYACYLYFQLSTHVEMYNAPSQKSPKKPSSGRRKSAGAAIKALATTGGTSAAGTGAAVEQNYMAEEQDDEPEIPQLTKLGALLTLAGSTVLVAFCAEFMVSAISDISGSVSQEFIGLILLPIVGNAAEHATAVTVAIKDKMDLAIGVAVGSSLQIALLVLPLTVMLSWWGVPGEGPAMTLDFNGFQIVVLFIAVIVVNYLIGDGKSHWLEGVLLMITYMIIALAAWFYPVTGEVAG